jgi:glycosyltransferase involved in cell wall biosynthesis
LGRSLTVLLPVHNAQSTLAATVQEILEVVSELTARFEVVIVDDGSDDATSEVAHELNRAYPQIRALRHGKRLGREVAIRTGLRQSTGEIILLHDEAGGLAIDGIARLWRATDAEERVVEYPAGSGGRRWARLSDRHPLRMAGYQMFDRRTMEERQTSSQPTRPNYLGKLEGLALDD